MDAVMRTRNGRFQAAWGEPVADENRGRRLALFCEGVLYRYICIDIIQPRVSRAGQFEVTR